MFTTKKIAAVSVINDLVTDSRVNKTCNALMACGYTVVLTGRALPSSLPIPAWPFRATRMKMLFKTGPLFYFFFNLRLFFRLLLHKADLLYANDLDTLLPNYLVSKLRGIPLIYDSHELFCEVPELQNTPVKKRIWLALEGWIVPRLKTCITVNNSIALIFEKKYKVTFHVIRNIPEQTPHFIPRSRRELSLPPDKKIILLQGAGINVDRGAEELIEAMPFVDALLLIIGGGDVWPALKEKVRALGLGDKVKLIDKIPKAELLHYTFNADLGLSIDKASNLNYYNSLPNKLFDYIHAGVPVLASRLPEIENIVTQFKIGDFIENHEPRHIASKLNALLYSPLLTTYKQNTVFAARSLSWAVEEQKLKDLILHAQQ